MHDLMMRAHQQEIGHLEAGQSVPSPPSVDEIRAGKGYVLGALADALLIGLVSLGFDDEPGQIAVVSLLVHPQYQRRGVARALMMEAIRLGKGAAFSVVAMAANTPALALYRQLGFMAYRRGTLGTGAVAMVKLRLAGTQTLE